MTAPPGRSPDPALVARALRQRMEAGAPPLFLESLERDAVLALAASGRQRRTTGAREPATPGASGAPAPRPAAPTATPSAPSRNDASQRPADPPAPRPEAAADRPAPPAGGEGVTPPPDTRGMDADALREAVEACTRCRLAGTRTQAVFADGAPDARVMVVGEAPGANEDRTGLPFVGAAGKLLDLMLASVDLSRRDSVYICNVIKCRPPGNRNPRPDEIATCSPYLRRQIELVRPEALLAVGTFAGQLLTGRGDSPLGALRGRVHAYEGVPLVVTYHPAALLRNRGWSRPTWDDLQLLRQVLEGA